MLDIRPWTSPKETSHRSVYPLCIFEFTKRPAELELARRVSKEKTFKRQKFQQKLLVTEAFLACVDETESLMGKKLTIKMPMHQSVQTDELVVSHLIVTNDVFLLKKQPSSKLELINLCACVKM